MFSLKGVGQQSSHYCGVTLLSRPPGPTVLVTAAHCTYLCKSQEGKILPNCCCPNVGSSTCTDKEDCGTSPHTTEMTGDDVEVKCGEWDISDNLDEMYYVILPIVKLVRHPDFDISRGEQKSQFLVNDIAVIHVDDHKFESLSSTHNIYPACLPTPHLNPTRGVHSGWSTPPSREFVEDNVPAYLPYYKYFSRQWHFAMDISTCRDPVTDFLTGTGYKYPTNSFYPPATMCATEINGEFCPTSGESGSPLMVADQQGRLVAAGITSFTKGCSSFSFAQIFDDYSELSQLSENPAVYTRLSCYLPWVAEQYDMEYSPPEETDPACQTGQGDINEVTAEVCRTNPSASLWDARDGIETSCLFPFTLNGESYDTCVMAEISGLTMPVFRCPIRTVKNVETDYTDLHLTGSFCPTNSNSSSVDDGKVMYEWNDLGPVTNPVNGELELDPSNTDCITFPPTPSPPTPPPMIEVLPSPVDNQIDGRRPVFGTCKNNCPGGKINKICFKLTRL